MEQQVLEISHEKSIPPAQARRLFETGTRSAATSNRQAFQENPKTFANPFAKTVEIQTPEFINTEDPSTEEENDVILYGRSLNNSTPVGNSDSYIFKESPKVVCEIQEVLDYMKGNIATADREDMGSSIRVIIDGVHKMEELMRDFNDVVHGTHDENV